MTTALGGAYALLATPIYRSDVLVQVEDQKAGQGLLGDLSAAFGDSSPAETEIEILRSRAIVGDAVDELKLDLVARPRRFPLLGGFLARRHDPADGTRARSSAFARTAGAASGSGSTGSTSRSGSTASRSCSSRARAAGTCSAIRTARRSSRARWARPPPRTAPSAFVAELVARPGTEFQVARLRRDAGDRRSPGGPAHLREGQEDGHPAARARGRRSARGPPRSSTRSRAPTSAATWSGRAPRRRRRSSSSRSSSPSCAANLDAAETEYETLPLARRAAWT